jgi:hypothetical protein
MQLMYLLGLLDTLTTSHQECLSNPFRLSLDLLPASLIPWLWLWHCAFHPAPWSGLGNPQRRGIEHTLALPMFRPSACLAWIMANILTFLPASVRGDTGGRGAKWATVLSSECQEKLRKETHRDRSLTMGWRGQAKNMELPGMVAQVCNLWYLGGGDQGIVVQGQSVQKLVRLPSQPVAGVMGHAWHPSYAGSINRRMWSSQPGHKVRPLS